MNDNLTIAYMQDLKLIKECNEYESNVDDLTEENTTTIEESEDQTDMNEVEECEESIEDQEGQEVTNEDDDYDDDDDGWSEEIQDVCNQLIEDFDGFSYELRNCKRGSFTGVDTGEGLGEFLEDLKLKIEDVIDSVKSLEK